MSDEVNNQDLDEKLLAGMLKDFLEEAVDHLDQLNLNLIQLEEDPADEVLIDVVFRVAHTIKGSSAFVGLTDISGIARKMEDVLGDVRKGTLKITSSIIKDLYVGVDAMTALVDKASGNENIEVDVGSVLNKLDNISEVAIGESEEKETNQQEKAPLDEKGILAVYKESYDQLAALKHIVYSSVHLFDPISLAVVFSKQIDERMSAHRNSVWLMASSKKIKEIARNGKLVNENKPRILEIESSEILKRAIYDQIVVWPSSYGKAKNMFPEFQSPVLFPIKGKPEAYGILVVDPEESEEIEVYQFVGHFAAMILSISNLHEKVEKQRKELNEMTEILFKQNTLLSSLYHIELDMMKAPDPIHLCHNVVESVIGELGARRAAAFLLDESSQELIVASQSAGLEAIDSMKFSIEEQAPIKKCIESGRVVTYRDFKEEFRIGPNLLENWMVLCLKGRERVQGILVLELEDEDNRDSISILVNHASTIMDNLILQKKVVEKADGI